jgi:hypothetical protein
MQMFIVDGFHGVSQISYKYEIDMTLLNNFISVLMGERSTKRKGLIYL